MLLERQHPTKLNAVVPEPAGEAGPEPEPELQPPVVPSGHR